MKRVCSLHVMFQPRHTKFRKYQRGSPPGLASNTTALRFGIYGIQAMASGRVSPRTLEAVRRVLTRRFRRTGRIWIRRCADLVVTRKPSEARMGKGKGSPDHWIAKVKAGAILVEMDGIPEALARQAVASAANKFPMRVRFLGDPQHRGGGLPRG
jgi:large subunit ribosomal protein L16